MKNQKQIKRDKPATIARFIQAVGEEIEENYTFLIGVNQIAKRAQMSKSSIYHCFGGYDSLLIAYFNSRDVCDLVLAAFPFPENANSDELKAHLKTIMEELGIALRNEARLREELIGHIDDQTRIPVPDTDNFITRMGNIMGTAAMDFNIAFYPLTDLLVLYLEGIYYLAFPAYGDPDLQEEHMPPLDIFTLAMNFHIDRAWVEQTDEEILAGFDIA